MNGILLIDKPVDMTSHDVVARVRRLFRMKKVGHAGTLDPFATGLLVLCLGQATRIVQYLTNCNKEYTAVMKLGETTDTQDCTGKMAECKNIPELTETHIVKLFEMFSGEILQTPPMFSARRVKGKRLYEIARAGKTVEREARSVTIQELELLAMESPFIRFRVLCSKGTYIRTLAHDMGETLKCGAHLTALRRTRSGHFDVAQAYPLEQLEQMEGQAEQTSSLLSIGEALSFLPSMTVCEPECTRLLHGTSVLLPSSDFKQPAPPEEQPFIRLYDSSERCVALVQIVAAKQNDEEVRLLQPVKVFTLDT